MPFYPAPQSDILSLLIQLGVLLFAARGLGEIASRLGQPSVLGEILAGVILGPSLLGHFFPGIAQWWIPTNATQGHLLETISLIGALFLLLITGLETDLHLIRKHANLVLAVSLSGVTVTLLAGFWVGQILPDRFLSDPSDRILFSVFLATAMSISSIPVIARVLIEQKMIRRDIGQNILAVGMSDDTIGWILLSVIVAISSDAGASAHVILFSVIKIGLFVLFSFTVGSYLIKKSFAYVQDHVLMHDRLLSLILIFVFFWGAIAEAIHIESLLGAFLVGVLFARIPRLPPRIYQKIESMAFAVFSPIFFAAVGLKINVVRLFEPELLLISIGIIAVAIIAKFVGTFFGARLIGRKDTWSALSFGAGLNARGAVQVIVATIGLKTGILSQDMFSIIILMAIVTSVMSPPLLRRTLKHVKPDDEEQKRLHFERIMKGSLIGDVRRVLLPVRLRSAESPFPQNIEPLILEKLKSGKNLSITLICVPTSPAEEAAASRFLSDLAGRFADTEVIKKVIPGEDPAIVILNEAQKDYDLLMLGAPQKGNDFGMLFSPVIDKIVRMSPCATLVVQGNIEHADWKKILVPTNGRVSGKSAVEVAFSLASGKESEVTLLTVVQGFFDDWYMENRVNPDAGRGFISARQILTELREIGIALGVKTKTLVRSGDDPVDVILDVARNGERDLIVIGTDIRSGSHRLFLGPTVERLLRNAPCPVIVVNGPAVTHDH